MLRSALAPLRRGLHTSAVRAEAPSRQITSDFLTRLQTPSSSSTSSSKAQEATRGMLGTVGLRDLTIENDGRKTFKDGKVSPPHTYEEASMYPEARRPARLPIMGPPNRVAKLIDPFHIRHSNPLEHAMNPLMCYKFINSMGKIKPRAETGLTWRSQRLVGKMVRRARAMGVIPRWDNRPRPGGLGDSDYASR